MKDHSLLDMRYSFTFLVARSTVLLVVIFFAGWTDLWTSAHFSTLCFFVDLCYHGASTGTVVGSAKLHRFDN